MKTLPLLKVSGLALAITLGWGIGVAVDAQTKTLVIYSGRDEKLIGPLIEKAKKDLNKDIQVRYGSTAELAIALLEEGQNSRADLFFAQDAGALGNLEKKQVTLPIPSKLLDKVDARFRSAKGYWLGISGRARVISYNTKLVNRGELPLLVSQLTQPKWRGKVGWAPTNASFQSFITAKRVLEGDGTTLQWLKAMKANGVKDYAGNSAIVEAVGRGEVYLGLVNNYYLYNLKKNDPNLPVANHYTIKDAGAMINVAGVAITKTTDQKADVEALIDYLLKPSSQNYFAQETNEYPLVKGIPAPSNQIPINKLNPPNLNLTDLDDLPGTLNLLKQAGVL
ncbi:iron ABC transporter substrate-binding protein [Nostoc sp. CHAB 5836]|uniref:iron ABC transporter substrate-binding protein n=1 Tax=Nostoc sp. CHAB 5836 TaxID=2780404 RepID=UPI001E3028C3|nr:iron ABC transporter substrate-binding protein [Nostoc sp. CHAB 5836]MCC5614383.1 iron ABC transporter substrate-binding protein [Nostoc sp. CHAB 5836]